jgi:hypothetical protein
MFEIFWIVVVSIFLIFIFLNWLSKKKNRKTPEEVATIIESFIQGRGGCSDWDDFISVSIHDDSLDWYRYRCATLPVEYPTTIRGQYCNEEGIEVVRNMVSELRAKKNSK